MEKKKRHEDVAIHTLSIEPKTADAFEVDVRGNLAVEACNNFCPIPDMSSWVAVVLFLMSESFSYLDIELVIDV